MTHRPNDEKRRLVESMSAAGIDQDSIARVIGINRDTLAKHYREELDNAASRANMQISERLFTKAMEGDTTALIWWSKARMGWKETKKEERRLVDKDDNDVKPADIELLKKMGYEV